MRLLLDRRGHCGASNLGQRGRTLSQVQAGRCGSPMPSVGLVEAAKTDLQLIAPERSTANAAPWCWTTAPILLWMLAPTVAPIAISSRTVDREKRARTRQRTPSRPSAASRLKHGVHGKMGPVFATGGTQITSGESPGATGARQGRAASISVSSLRNNT